MDIFTSVLPMILEPLVGPIKRHIGYVFQFRSKVNDFGDKVKLLELEKESLLCSIDNAQRRGEEVEKHVLEWRTRADTAIGEAQVLVRKGEEEAQRGRCSLRLTARYRMGKKAAQGTPGIVQLLEEKSRLGSMISHRPDLKQIVRALSVEGYEAESRKTILNQVMDALLDPNVTMVGVYGMGGIGKTTLAEEVQRQAMQNSLFNKVVMAMVTATPDIKRIQDMIAEFVTGSKLDESTDTTRASRLHQILKDMKVLIILDDLWSMFELDKVGIPSWNVGKGCKILLTSRNEDILSNMGSRKNFRLEFLSEEESMSLFKKKVVKFDYPEIAEQILAKCSGFPLLIVTVGGALRNKGLHVWKNALTQISKFEDGDVVKKVHSILESSYDNLGDDKTKQIFLLFAISSQSDIMILNLLRYGLGLSFFKGYTVCEARNHLKTLIDDLKACSLLDVDKRGNPKMHDIIRETAIRIARRNKYAFRERDGKALTEWPSRGDINGCSIVSIPQSSDIRQLPEDLGCPDVELLLLFCNWHSVDIPDSTFEGTIKLKVIHFARMELASLPIGQSHSLTNLHTLRLEDCHLLDLTTITRLKSLEILSFRGSDLEALPNEIGKLTRMKSLDLTDCSKLSFIPSDLISKLNLLEELLMGNSFDNWEVEEGTGGTNARLSELKCLPRLDTLEVRVPDTRALPKDLFSNQLEKFQILIGRKWKFDETANTLKVDFDMRTDFLPKVRGWLKDLEILYLHGSMTSYLYDLEKEEFLKLKKLHVAASCELQLVVDCRKWGPTVCLRLLESLKLEGLTSMVTICQGLPAPESFSQMKRLEIIKCDKLTNLFSLSAVRSLPQLEEIEVRQCDEMEALFVAESDCKDKANEVVEFPRLHRLGLHQLPQLKCFLYAKEKPIGSGSSETAKAESMSLFNEKVALPSLETLSISCIDGIEMIWCSQLASSALDKLNFLEIQSCHKLQKVSSSGSLERFQNLKSLLVHSCDALEEIYQFGDGVVGGPNGDPMKLGLNDLSLFELSRLKRIWKEDSNGQYYGLHNLVSARIWRCGSLENVFPLVVAKTLSQLKSLEVTECGKLKEIVAEEEEEYSSDLPCILFPALISLEIADCPKANIFGAGKPHFPNQRPFFSLEKVVPNLKAMTIDSRIFKSMSSNYLIGLEYLRLSLIRGMTLVEVSQLENMPLLQKLAVGDSHVKNLWGSQTSGIDAGELSSSTSSIRILKLGGVGRLRHVWRPDSQMDPVLPFLEILELRWCEDLISLAPSPSASFRSLTTLELLGCSKLTGLVNPSAARTMGSLMRLRIMFSSALKEIVAAEAQQDAQTTRECIVFNKLKNLQLHCLASLEGFCISGSYSFSFPCLKEVSVTGCPLMRIFCNGEVITPKLHNVGSLRLWGRDLNIIIKLRFMDELQSISDLRLSRFPELAERWNTKLPFKRFSCIRELVVDQLPHLLPFAIPSNLLPALSGLEELAVEKCDSVEELFDLDGMDQENIDHIRFMSKLRQLKLVELPKLRHVWNKDLAGKLGLKYLSVLKVHNCGNLTHIFTLTVALELVHLENLSVTECPLVEVIIKQQSDEQLSADMVQHTVFPLLNQVHLENMPSLMGFFSGDFVLRCPNLKNVLVEGCPRMRILGSSTEQHENIVVQRREDRPCDGDVHEPALRILNKQVVISRLEGLIVQWNSSMDNAWHEIVPQSFLCSLEVVKLMGFPADHELLPSDFVQGMPNLKKFSIVDSFCKQILPRGPTSVSEIQPAISFKKLTHFELFNLQELSHLVEEDSQSGSLFQHLKILKVSKCKRLTRLLTSISAKGLVSLEKLAVEECERMTEVVSSNGKEAGVEMVFEKLKSLKLHGLPSLARFSSGNCAFNFPRLNEVVVKECPNMKTFAQNTLSTPMLNYVQIAGDDDDDDNSWRLVEDGLNGNIEKLFAETNPSSVG